MNFNKQNKIIIAALVLLVVLSIGYALFSDSVKIQGSATAKGDFQITSSCDLGFPAFLEEQIGSENLPPQGGYNSEYCDVNGTEVTYGAIFEYPTAARTFTTTMENTGTIPAKVNLENGIVMESTITFGGEAYEHSGFVDDFVMFFRLDGQLYMDIEEVPAENVDDEGSVIVNPGDSIIYIVDASWDSLFSGDAHNNVELTSINKLKVNFEQVTAQ